MTSKKKFSPVTWDLSRFAAFMWYALDITLEEAAREAVEYALAEAGALGTESSVGADAAGLVRASAYFDAPPDRDHVRAELFEALRIYELPSSSVRELAAREVEARDWLGEWKKNWQPVRVGERFVVAPPWSVLDADERLVIRIEPGMAFGTGTHETTRLCLEAVEKYFDGASLLDVGTGTGILAIAAAKLRPGARVEACDTDADAVEIAQENARLNGVGDRIDFRVGSVGVTAASADFVCANLTADVILPLLPALVGATCGRLVLSGILDVQAEEVRSALAALGVTGCETRAEGEWVAIII